MPTERGYGLDEKSLRRAYRERSRLVHPDARADGADSAEAEEEVRELNRAYETLRRLLC